MEGLIVFRRVTEGPDFALGVYADVVPTSATHVLLLWGGSQINRRWTELRDNARECLDRIGKFGGNSKAPDVWGYQEGGYVGIGRGMVLAASEYGGLPPVLLSTDQSRQLITDWLTVLETRPHKIETLPAALSFEYLRDGEEADEIFSAAFEERAPSR